MIFYLNEKARADLSEILSKKTVDFDDLMGLDGDVFRALENRKTLRFQANGSTYYIKQHFGIGWREVFKNLCHARQPIVSAKNEWVALEHLMQGGIEVPRVMGFGERGSNPAKKQSFILMSELENKTSMHDFCEEQKVPCTPDLKQAMITALAKTIRKMHALGVNHRDCYLVHVWFDNALFQQGSIQLCLHDFHRAHVRKKISRRWRVKDLASLYFSSINFGLTQKDIEFFLTIYFQQDFKTIAKQHAALLHAIEKKAHRLYQREFGKKASLSHG
jgi:heptose I phosphotransferase